MDPISFYRFSYSFQKKTQDLLSDSDESMSGQSDQSITKGEKTLEDYLNYQSDGEVKCLCKKKLPEVSFFRHVANAKTCKAKYGKDWPEITTLRKKAIDCNNSANYYEKNKNSVNSKETLPESRSPPASTVTETSNWWW